MKKTIAKFRSIPSFRKSSIALVAGVSSFVATSSFAAGGMGDAATAAITDAQSQGIAVGGSVVACVAALCVVGIIIALVRKV